MPRNHSVCKVHAVFLLLEAKEAVEVIEASDVIMSVEVIEATESFKSNLTCIFLPARARYIISNPDGGPCKLPIIGSSFIF